ncbi:GPP34 family phosphoprotein [Streptomyces sp. NA04227]|uniref:GOLPH3/VPS74 family protein n=1 Tax=Streptomyces sp. NA04227 TaxID=2742136 RepID=UPI001591EEAC|nr:GPP34 family phosphoprotein [Streptomyces sp. NA04227]QKW10208.1 GPP34 family phosphoprotein [Streptomyces sp. NA04227]
MAEIPQSLPARLYLLAWDAREGRLTGAARLSHLLRAGALTELAQRGLLTDDDGVATPADPDAETGDPALDGLLELITESRPRTWKEWVGSRTELTRTAVQDSLTDAGFLRTERKRVLGLFPSVEHLLTDPAPVERLQSEAREVLCGPVPVARIPDREAALVCLAAVAELNTFATAEERRAHKDRLAQLTERGGMAAPALGKVFQEVQVAIMLAATSVTLTTGASGS